MGSREMKDRWPLCVAAGTILECEDMLPVVDVDQPMSSALLDALLRFEADCACDGLQSVTMEQARQWIEQRFGADIAAEFQPQMLLSNPEP